MNNEAKEKARKLSARSRSAEPRTLIAGRRRIDLCGRRYGRLSALKFVGMDTNHSLWLCLCDCSNTIEVRLNNLQTGHTRSCGCLSDESREDIDNKYITHGHSRGRRSPTYQSWRCMRERCEDSNNRGYRYYGAKGVKVCERWLKFENFLTDMGERPKSQTLDRINPFGNYEPSNCRWATDEVQSQNRRRRHGRAA